MWKGFFAHHDLNYSLVLAIADSSLTGLHVFSLSFLFFGTGESFRRSDLFPPCFRTNFV